MPKEETNKLLFPEEFITFLSTQYPISFCASSIFSIPGILVSANGLYLVPGAIVSYSVAALNIVAPKEYNIILPLFEKCHNEKHPDLFSGVIEDGSCIIPSIMLFPSFTIFSIAMIPSAIIEHSAYKIIEFTNSIINYLDNEITDLYSGLVDDSYSFFEAY